MDSGRLIFGSAAPSRAAGAGGGQMMLFGGSGSLLGGSPVVAGVEDGRRKRPFLTSPEEELQLDDEMYGYYGLDENAPERKRRLTAEQVRALERSFEEEKRKLEPERGVVPPVQEKKKRLSGAAIAAIAVGAAAAALLALILLVLCFVRRRRDDAAASGDNRNKVPTPTTPARGHALTPSTVSGEMTDLTSSKEIPSAVGGGAAEMMRSRLVFMGGGSYSFDLEDLLRASAEVLGNGVAGTTYRAALEDGTTVAVKRLKNVAAAQREFASAVEAVGRVQHRNLLPVRGYYYSSDEKLLVADFLPDGSLSAALHGSGGSGRTPMDWNTRKCAALSAARGVAYLHAAHSLTHGNLKSSSNS